MSWTHVAVVLEVPLGGWKRSRCHLGESWGHTRVLFWARQLPPILNVWGPTTGGFLKSLPFLLSGRPRRFTAYIIRLMFRYSVLILLDFGRC